MNLCLEGLGWGMRGTEVEGELGSSAHNEPALMIFRAKCHNLSFSGILRFRIEMNNFACKNQNLRSNRGEAVIRCGRVSENRRSRLTGKGKRGVAVGIWNWEEKVWPRLGRFSSFPWVSVMGVCREGPRDLGALREGRFDCNALEA